MRWKNINGFRIFHAIDQIQSLLSSCILASTFISFDVNSNNIDSSEELSRSNREHMQMSVSPTVLIRFVIEEDLNMHRCSCFSERTRKFHLNEAENEIMTRDFVVLNCLFYFSPEDALLSDIFINIPSRLLRDQTLRRVNSTLKCHPMTKIIVDGRSSFVFSNVKMVWEFVGDKQVDLLSRLHMIRSNMKHLLSIASCLALLTE